MTPEERQKQVERVRKTDPQLAFRLEQFYETATDPDRYKKQKRYSRNQTIKEFFLFMAVPICFFLFLIFTYPIG